MKRLLLLIAALFTCASAATAQYPITNTAGISSEKFDEVYAHQDKSQWCWAASIEMVLRHGGVQIEQEDIVRRAYHITELADDLPNWTGSFDTITRSLNHSGEDKEGRSYRVTATVGQGAPVPALLIKELQAGRPVVLAYSTGPMSGHAVVCTGVGFAELPQGPLIEQIVVRDPWPIAGLPTGRREYAGLALAGQCTAHWFVHVTLEDTKDKSKAKRPSRAEKDDEDRKPATPKARFIECTECDGSGKIECDKCDGSGEIKCSACRGRGQANCTSCGGKGTLICAYGPCPGCRFTGVLVCASCMGSGRTACAACSGTGTRTCPSCHDGKKKCPKCKGTGKVREETDPE